MSTWCSEEKKEIRYKTIIEYTIWNLCDFFIIYNVLSYKIPGDHYGWYKIRKTLSVVRDDWKWEIGYKSALYK